MEAAAKLPAGEGVRDLSFNYFTAGLGGSGDVNLYITNVGFGEPVWGWEDGQVKKRLVAGDETLVTGAWRCQGGWAERWLCGM
jgi:hypothetical protein